MKRFIIAAIAASAFAMPSAASADTATTAPVAPCTSPIVYCVQQILDRIVVADPSVCQYGETYSECAFRIVRDTPDFAITLVEAYVNYAGMVVGNGLETAKALCGQVIRSCGTL